MMTWSGTSVPWPGTEPGSQCSPWHLSALKKDFSKEVKSSETSNVLIRREDTCRGSTGRLRERESCTLSRWIKLLIQGQFFLMSSGQSSCFDFESLFSLAQGPPFIGKDPDAGKDWGQEEKGETEVEMVGWITDSMDMSLSKLQEIVKDRDPPACCSL